MNSCFMEILNSHQVDVEAFIFTCHCSLKMFKCCAAQMTNTGLLGSGTNDVALIHQPCRSISSSVEGIMCFICLGD